MLRSRSLTTLLLGLFMIIIIGRLNWESSDPIQRSQTLSEHFWVNKTHNSAKFDMVLMGDSRTYRDLSPQAMRSVLEDYRIFNLGYSNGSFTPIMFREAERRLDQASKKRVILMGVTPVSLTPKAAENGQFLQEKGRPLDYIISRLYFYQFINTFNPLTPKDILQRIFNKAPASPEGYFQEFHDDGWVASWTVPEDPTKALESYREFFSNTRVSPEIVDGLIQQTRLWTQEGIKVFAFRPPTTMEMVDLENKISGFDEETFIKQFSDAGGIWLTIRNKTYHSYDGSHLDKESAIQLSQDLAKHLVSYLQASND